MSEAPLMVGVSGLRGIVGKSLTPEVAARFAGAFGGWLIDHSEGLVRVVVGRDGRRNADAIYFAAIGALLGAGCDVEPVDVAATPSVAFAAGRLGGAGLIVTASHNPQEWNGLKCLVPSRPGRGACAPTPEIARQIIERFETRGTTSMLQHAPGHVAARNSPADEHAQHVWSRIEHQEGPGAEDVLDLIGRFRVVLDSVNASGAAVGRRLLEGSFGCDLIHVGASDSGVFPHPPEPLRENVVETCRITAGTNASVGFVQDPDADRLAIIDERGEFIGEEYTLALGMESVLTAPRFRELRGTVTPVVCANLSTSRMIDDISAQHGARVVRTPVGEASVVEAMMKEQDAVAGSLESSVTGRGEGTWREGRSRSFVLGGEGNGGIIWPQATYVRDSLSAMALVLALMARTGKSVSQLVEQINTYSPGGRGYAIEKRKAEIAHRDDALSAVEKIKAAYATERLDTQDGVRVDFTTGPLAGRAWLHVRASNTEPIMRLIAEAPSKAEAEGILEEAARVIAD